MSNAAKRLELYQAVLWLIEAKRAETGDETLGADIERVVTEAQFCELELDIMQDPGALEAWLIRRDR